MNTTRDQFPGLHQRIHNKPLAFLDSAASSQPHSSVIDAMDHYLRHDHANVHRGVYELSQRATKHYDTARSSVAQLLNAPKNTIVFTRGTTEAINLVAHGMSALWQTPATVLLTMLEHHANIVPWQQVAAIDVVDIDQQGHLKLETLEAKLANKPKLLALTHISNAIGTVNDIKTIIAMAHAHNVPVLIDGAQAIAHRPVDVTDLDCDFYVFGAHKMYGPTGIGALYAKPEWLERMPPYQTGGDMIDRVSFEKTTFAKAPAKFEAGTPNIVGAVGLHAAVAFLNTLDWQALLTHEKMLLDYAVNALEARDDITLIGAPSERSGCVSFTMDNVHPHDLGTIADQHGVAIRTGHHCAQPLMAFYNVPATARLSVGCYTTTDDIDQLMTALDDARELFN